MRYKVFLKNNTPNMASENMPAFSEEFKKQKIFSSFEKADKFLISKLKFKLDSEKEIYHPKRLFDKNC